MRSRGVAPLLGQRGRARVSAGTCSFCAPSPPCLFTSPPLLARPPPLMELVLRDAWHRIERPPPAGTTDAYWEDIPRDLLVEGTSVSTRLRL